jgi:hypothetical protein
MTDLPQITAGDTLAAGHPEYELLDTGIFNGNRYFDVVIESPGLFVDLGPWPSHLLALQ